MEVVRTKIERALRKRPTRVLRYLINATSPYDDAYLRYIINATSHYDDAYLRDDACRACAPRMAPRMIVDACPIPVLDRHRRVDSDHLTPGRSNPSAQSDGRLANERKAVCAKQCVWMWEDWLH
jgi:hypothetical protein